MPQGWTLVAPASPGLLEPGNVDMGTRPRVKNADGTTSTVRSISANIDGREVLIPTVSDDGRVLSNEDAIASYQRTGKHLGMFDTPENATAFAQKLHESEAAKLSAAPDGWTPVSSLPPDRRANPNAKPPSAEDFTPSTGWPAKIGDVALGALKGVGSTAAGLGEMAVNAGIVPGGMPAGFDPAMRNPVFRAADEAMTPTNTAQHVGKLGEQVAEVLLPIGAAAKAGIEAIPSAARAGAKFQDVMGAAKSIPINPEAPGQIALRIQQLADRGGGSMPRPVSQFLQRVTNPDKAPLAYEEARDFASGISRLSANDAMRAGPAVMREIQGLRVALNKSVADAAAKAGKGAHYAEAMTEYAKAKRLSGLLDDVVSGAKGALPKAVGGGAAGAGAAGGWWLTKQIGSLLGGG